MKTNYHVGTAAEAIVAAQFARMGFEVSVQYGANQPEYDLVVTSDHHMLKISVKGSKEKGWGLTQSYLKNADYHGAIDLWLSKHKPKTVLCLVLFNGVELDQMPRIYLARPDEIAEQLKAASGGRGDTTLYEDYTRGARAQGAGTREVIPAEWKLSMERVQQLMNATL